MDLAIGNLVLSKMYGKGIITKISPSSSIVEVDFTNFGLQHVLSSSLLNMS